MSNLKILLISILACSFYFLFLNAPAPEKKIIGKTFITKTFNRNSVQDGLNFLSIRSQNKAYLFNNQGDIVHSWQDLSAGKGKWHEAKMDPLLNLYVIKKDENLSKLDPQSNVIWSIRGGFHHDFDTLDWNSFYILSRVTEKIKIKNKILTVLNDHINLMDKNGRINQTFSGAEILQDYISDQAIEDAYQHSLRHDTAFKSNSPADILHLNSVKIIRQDIPHICKAGDLLISSFHLNLIAILSQNTGKVLWVYPEKPENVPAYKFYNDSNGDWYLDKAHSEKLNSFPQVIHTPLIINKGKNLSYFDNGFFRGFSSMNIINIQTKEITRRYGDELKNFYTHIRGAAMPLENGNFLISVSNDGRAFEITPDDKIVWEMQINKQIIKDYAFYRLSRYPNKYITIDNPSY